MEYAVVDGQVRIERTAEEQEPLLQRLRRIEGQARGLQQMIMDNRYCLDTVQQLNALASAAREVALLLIDDHLHAGVTLAVQAHDPEGVAIGEMITVLRAAMRQYS